MAVIELNAHELLIPLHEQLISSIDKDQKIIHMEIPEGLLDL
jgi:ribosomal 30S subunit maturation factor RimM